MKDESTGAGGVLDSGVLGPREIQEIIPHRFPFLLVDRILEVTAGKSARGVKNVSANEPYFQGHFPGRPVMPAVLIAEAIAQVGAVALLKEQSSRGEGEKLAVFTGIDRMRFRRPVVPGDTLIIDVTIEAVKGPIGKARGVARVNEAIAAEGLIWFSLVDQVDTWLG